MANIFTFDYMILFGNLSFLLLFGLFLRSRIPFLQKFFVPACIIAGLIGLIVRTILVYFNIIASDTILLETIIYHIFNITFISLGLTTDKKEDISKRKKTGFKNISSMGLLIVTIAALQFLIGGGFVILFNSLGFNLYPTFGFLVTMGFEEGPGQALSIGKSWEGFGFTNAATIGLSFATLGYIFAIFVGVPLVYWAIKKGKVKVIGREISTYFKKGFYSSDCEKKIAGLHTTHPANIDSLTFHAALVGVVYVLTYGFLKLLEIVTPPDISELYWGFFFIWGLLIAFIVKKIILITKTDYILDSELQGRITGWGVDYLIVTAITSISLGIVVNYAVPILIMAVSVGIATLLWVVYFGPKIWKEYTFERTAGLYAMETGTVATGLLLIRIIDPDFRSPAAIDLALSSIIALPFMFVMFHFAAAPILLNWSIEITMLVFVAFLVGTLLFMKLFRLI
jgi:ESS family glutamate:Na+ symporter